MACWRRIERLRCRGQTYTPHSKQWTSSAGKGAGCVVVSARSRKMTLTLHLRSEELALGGRRRVHRRVPGYLVGPGFAFQASGDGRGVGATLAVKPSLAAAVLDGASVDVDLVHGSGLGRA
jgi:hypothetical protein